MKFWQQGLLTAVVTLGLVLGFQQNFISAQTIKNPPGTGGGGCSANCTFTGTTTLAATSINGALNMNNNNITSVNQIITPKAGTGNALPFQITVNGGTAAQFTTNNNHFELSATAPAPLTCGTSPTVAGNDAVGRLTVGTTPSTTCGLTFNAAFTNAPACVAYDETTNLTLRVSTVSTTAVTFTASGTLTAADKISYQCLGFF